MLPDHVETALRFLPSDSSVLCRNIRLSQEVFCEGKYKITFLLIITDIFIFSLLFECFLYMIICPDGQ